MDIARPDLKKKKRHRQLVAGAVAVVLVIAAVIGFSMLGPALPGVKAPVPAGAAVEP